MCYLALSIVFVASVIGFFVIWIIHLVSLTVHLDLPAVHYK